MMLPAPGLLSTAIVPPMSRTIPETVDRPRPVPPEVDLVVKKGSKIWVLVASSIPTPSSRTKSSTASMRRTMPLRDT